jgi:uncharacterized protein (DUF2141 family)
MRKKFIQLMVVITAITLGAGAAQAKNKEKPLDGSITSVDKTAKTVTIHLKKMDQTVTVESSAVITKDDKAATFDDLKPGVYALITTTASGEKLSAVTIKLSDTPIEKPKKKKKDA